MANQNQQQNQAQQQNKDINKAGQNRTQDTQIGADREKAGTQTDLNKTGQQQK